MVHDLLPVEKDHYRLLFLENINWIIFFSYQTVTTKGENRTRNVLLNEDDDIWVSLRHKHIADTNNWIKETFDKFLQENKATSIHSGVRLFFIDDKNFIQMSTYERKKRKIYPN